MAFSLASVLEKMTSRDRDYRYMATSDLSAELQKDQFKLETALADGEKKTCQALLKLLDDTSGDVQGMAVKCLGPLAKKVKESQIELLVDGMMENVLLEAKDKDELRDVSSIGLKTIIEEVPATPASIPSLIVKRLTPKLLGAITSTKKADTKDSKVEQIRLNCLEILSDLVQRFGSLMAADHEKLQKAVLPQLTSTRPVARKRAIGCLGFLSVSIPDSLFNSLVEVLIQNIETSDKADHIRTSIQCIGAISKSAGYRLGKYMAQVLPLILKYCDNPKFENDDELKENCFQCFEALVLRCPKEIPPYLPQIVDLCLKYLKHDPNYATGSDDEGGDGEDMETDENEGGGDDEQGDDDGDYSDDDDISWKIRRASAKCLSAIITTRSEMLQQMYKKVAPQLVARFKEREESVKIDVFGTFVDLLRLTSSTLKRYAGIQDSPISLLRQLVPSIVSGIAKQLKEKSPKTRSGAFSLLKELVLVLEGGLTAHVSALIPGIVFSLTEKASNSNLKIETLSFLRILLAYHPATAFSDHIKALADPVFKAVADPYFKISAEGLRVCSELVTPIRGHNAFIKPLYQVTLEKLKAQEIDQEVKECAITCSGLIVANLGDELKSDINEALNILLERLRNEFTRLTCVKALAKIAESPLKIDVSPILAESIKSLSSFLRQNQRQLKQSSLTTLNSFVKTYGDNKNAAPLLPSVLTEVASLISDADLHLSHLALQLCVTILHSSPATANVVQEKILPAAFTLIKSSLLQGLALQSILGLFAEMVNSGAKNLSFDQLLESLLGLVQKAGPEPIPKQCYTSISQCVAVLCLNTKPAQRDATVTRFIGDIKKAKDEQAKLLPLLCLGEIGKRADLGNQADELQKIVTGAFDSSLEDNKTAASFALGSIAVGSMSKFLPFVLAEINSQPKRQYLLLHSLREIIVRQSTNPEGIQILDPYVQQILPLLFAHCNSEEEGTRNVVAECLGKLALVKSQELVPELKKRLESPTAPTRATVVTAIKFTITEQPQAIDAVLAPHIMDFLGLLKDTDLNVRRNTLLTLNYAAHNKPSLIRDSLGGLLPFMYGETKIKPELIRIVDLGHSSTKSMTVSKSVR